VGEVEGVRVGVGNERRCLSLPESLDLVQGLRCRQSSDGHLQYLDRIDVAFHGE
jgi:hypothetical protein